MSIAAGFVMELEQEAVSTRRVLERIPDNKLSWKPHAKSMSLGQLALHVTLIPDMMSQLLIADLNGPPPSAGQPEAATRAELLDSHSSCAKAGKARLEAWSDEDMMKTWTFSIGGRTLMSVPRAGAVRALMFNHLYHHRGQLQVYLRLIGEPVPSVYGPTADENPFA